MSDYIRSIIRTVLPGVWSVIVLQLVKLGLPDAAAGWLSSSPVVEKATDLVALAAVYAFVRWVEPRLPAGLVRILLGSVKQPTYTG